MNCMKCGHDERGHDPYEGVCTVCPCDFFVARDADDDAAEPDALSGRGWSMERSG